MAEDLWEGIARPGIRRLQLPVATGTVVGVRALWTPDLLGEIEATAVLT